MHHCFVPEHTNDHMEHVNVLYQEHKEKSASDSEDTASISQKIPCQVSMYFNSIDFAFVNEYIHKCQYGEKGLGKK